MGIGSALPTQSQVSNVVQPAVQQAQSTPQPMGGKGGGLGTNPYAQSPSQPPQPMGGKGGMPYQPQLPDFMSPRGATTGGPRTLPTQQQPQFDDKTTQAEFDRARGITPAEQPMQTRTPQALPQSAEDAFRNATTNVRFASSADMEAAKQDFMNQYNQRDALKRQYAMPGQDYRSVNPVQIEQMRQMQQPQFMGGKGGGFNPYAGGFGGGFNPYAGGFGGGLGGLAALLQGRQFKDGGEVK